MRSRATLLLVLILPILSCSKLVQDGAAGISGRSFVVGNDFVILTNGFRLGKVTWVAVRNWPLSSTAEARQTDSRVTLKSTEGWLIRRSDGRSLPPDPEPRLYFFDGEKLTDFRIALEEDDLTGFRPANFTSYDDVLGFFKKFEVQP